MERVSTRRPEKKKEEEKKIVCPVLFYLKHTKNTNLTQLCPKRKEICCLHCPDLENCRAWVCPQLLHLNRSNFCTKYGLTKKEAERLLFLTHLKGGTYADFQREVGKYLDKKKEQE